MQFDEESSNRRTAAMSFRLRLARSRPIKLLGGIAIKCWAFSGAYVLVCFILYWLYGGIFAFILLCFATTGKLHFNGKKRKKNCQNICGTDL